MDERFKTLLIDEPELGLSPRVQRALSQFIHDPVERTKYFPHLKQVVIATHSNLFLNHADLSSNFVVTKSGTEIKLDSVDSMATFHRLQFNLLGNSLDGLFFPAGIVYVEGQTDHRYVERVITYRHPGRNIVVVSAGNDSEIKRKIHGLQESLGSLQTSPLRGRVFVVVDSVHERGLKDDLVKLGLAPENFIAWKRNGIEYLYPPELLAALYKCDVSQLGALTIAEDRVSLNDITHTKNALCDLVLKALTPATQLPEELVADLLTPLGAAVAD